jgi:PEP-CTERM motif-containing protein
MGRQLDCDRLLLLIDKRSLRVNNVLIDPARHCIDIRIQGAIDPKATHGGVEVMLNKTYSRALMPAFAGGLMAAMATLGLLGSAQGKAIEPSVSGGGAPSICNAIAGNLVNNCGLENGNFTGWTTTPAAFGSDFDVTSNPTFVNSGNFGSAFGATNPPFKDMISQSIPTIAGDAYSISFFLRNNGGTPSQITGMFGSTNFLSLTDPAPFGYTEFTDTVVATGNSTALSFAAFQAPNFFGLDDVSVLPVAVPVAVPEPASLVLLGGALFAFGAIRRRRRAVQKTPSTSGSHCS